MAQPPFVTLLGKGNLFADFAKQVDEWKVETPQPFMFLSLATALGHLIGYRAWVQYASPYRTYPSLSSLLLSPSGICRRGVGSGIVIEITKRAGGLVLDGVVTPEGIIDMLKVAEARDAGKEMGSRLLVYIEEMGDTFSKKRSQEHLVSRMTALLNRKSDWDDVTRGGMRGPMGEIRPPLRVTKPCLSVLLTSAPDWFLESMPREAKSGGLLSRIISCYLEDRDVVHVDLHSSSDVPTDVLQPWADKLRWCADSVKGPYVIGEEANAWYRDWYLTIEGETRSLDEGHVRTIRVRLPENMLKIAMLLAASRGRQELTVEVFEQAYSILNWMEPTMTQFYSYQDSMGTAMGQAERRLLAVLGRTPGWLKHVELGHAMGPYVSKLGGVNGLKNILQVLCERGTVEYLHRDGAKGTTLSPFIDARAWPPKAWRLVKEVKDGIGEE